VLAVPDAGLPHGYNGKWLSKSRFLFIAQFQQLFTEKIIAEMRGYQLDDGTSPFYEGLGRHFFKMDFNHVDGLTAIGKKSFIAELMPRQPLYVDYLPEDAREVIGQVHRSTLPARKLLEQEGMHYEGYVDIFDAGPVLQGRVSELRAVRDSVLTVAEEGARTARPTAPWCRTRSSTISA
jgi:arginine N-succinyltransferase